MNSDDVPAAGTNNDLFVVPIQGGAGNEDHVEPRAPITRRSIPLMASTSHGGSQARAGYESDKWRLMVLERATGKLTSHTDAIDRAVNSFVWSPDSRRLFFTVEGPRPSGHSVHRSRRRRRAYRQSRVTTRSMTCSSPPMARPSSFTASKRRRAHRNPAKPSSTGGAAIPLTHLNDNLLAQYQLTSLEDFWVTGAENTQVQSFLVKPPNFDSARKYPVLMLITAGRRGEWGESWTYRWKRAYLRRRRLRCRDAESARVHWLRPEVHRRHPIRIGAANPSTTSWPSPTTSPTPVRRSRPHGRCRRLLRGLHDRLDARPHRSL